MVHAALSKIATVKISNEEKETFFFFREDKVICESTIPKDFNKCLKRGWTPIDTLEYNDGTIIGMTLEAPRNAISIRNAVTKKRNSSVSKEEFVERMRRSKSLDNSR